MSANDLPPGAEALAVKLFRHKTAKGSFRTRFWLIVCLQATALAGWLWCCKNRPPWLPPSLRFLFPQW